MKVTAGDVEFDATVRIDTPGEANYYRNGGIMQYVLRNLRRGSGHSRSHAAATVGRMIVAFSISPTPADDTGGVSEAVAAAVRVVRESGLPNETNAMFTNIEGEWDEVMAVVKRAVDVVAAVSPRVGLVLKADIRPGFEGEMTAKVERVEQALRG